MSLTLPNLDDRTFADLMEESRSLLVTYAPDLTNHNPSDPLITLTELFAYSIEILLFRLNLVTDANRLAFLRLLNGPDSRVGPPDSERAPTHAEIDAEIRATVLRLRRVDRAVTSADFEFLALTADPAQRIARAQCHPDLNLELADPASRASRQRGHVSVVIVPAENASLDTLIPIVTAHLESRRLLGTRVHVVGPRLVPVTVQVTLNLLPDALPDVVTRQAIAALEAHFDPVVGRGGTGWRLGRDVFVSEIYRLLDGLAGVDFVMRTPGAAPLQMLDELATTDAFRGRFERNAAAELISLSLLPDELADISADIKIELPTS